MIDAATGKQVILFNPLIGYYSRVTRDLPMAVLSIARHLHPDYVVTIVDQKVPGWEKKLHEALAADAICFGTTAITGKQIHFALEATKYVKERSKVPVVWGGIHATMLPRQTIENPHIDMVIAGEGEESFNQLVRALDDGGPLDGIPGLWRKRDGQVIEPQAPSRFLDLDALPFLPYNVLDPKDYRGRASMYRGDVFDLEVGRGCPHRCAYCYNSSFNKGKRRSMSAGRILEHIYHLMTWTDIDGVSFIDDNLLIDRRRTEELVERLEQEHLNIVWYGETDINELKDMDDTMLARLERSGLRVLDIGVESGSPRILKLVNKKIRVEDALEVNRRLARFNFSVNYNFMSGFVTETKAELQQTTSVSLQILQDNPNATVRALAVVVPYPGTQYLEMAKEHGFVMPGKLEEWATCNLEDWADHCPWLDARARRRFKALHVASMFLDKKTQRHLPGNTMFMKLLRLFSRMYRFIARWRYRHCFGGLGLDVKLLELTKRCLMR